MSSQPTILHVALNKPLRHCFDYFPPENVDVANLMPGMRVQVPFGKKHIIGVILKINQTPCISLAKVKPVTAILDEIPALSKSLLALCLWAGRYYQHPLGEVIASALPVYLRKNSQCQNMQKSSKKTIVLHNAAEPPLTLDQHQKKALETILASRDFQAFLLEGVTGSGKTEVYLQVIAHYLQAGKQALILVPEIGLTPQTIARFANRFSVPIAALHSKLTERQRLEVWQKTKSGEVRIVIGTRSAIFTPLAQPGIIILDEEHDSSFKQMNGLRYSARDLAMVRGQLEKMPVILGSATPSMETLYNAQKGRFVWLKLPERAGKAIPPSFKWIDLRNQYLEDGLSSQLLAAIKHHLDQNNQVLLFLNRRGFSPSVLCHHCGWAATCKRCDAKLTLHHQPPRLVCHHCTSIYSVPRECGHCHQNELFHAGVGTERLECALRHHFPDVPVYRMDRDTISKKDSLEKMLESIQFGTRQILIGTQMLAKGHHFPNVTMVGILNTDSGLYSSDFRAVESMGQLILQVAGRAGRAEKPGEVYLQTHNPEHPLLQLLVQRGYMDFAAEVLRERMASKWPPFSYLALLRAESLNAKSPMNFLSQAKEIAKNLPKANIKILGPIPALMERKAGHFRALLLFQADDRSLLQKWLELFVPEVDKIKASKKTRWSIDIDPSEILC